MKKNINESEMDTALTMKMIYEFDMGKEFCKQLDKKYLTENHSKSGFKIKVVIKKIIFKILRLQHDR